jgi:hypothetical protein
MSDYKSIAVGLADLIKEKQEAYGDAFGRAGQVLSVIFPDGVPPDKYDDMLGIARVIDKLFRLANNKNAFGESPWEDIAGYGLLGAGRDAVKRSKLESARASSSVNEDSSSSSSRKFPDGTIEMFGSSRTCER